MANKTSENMFNLRQRNTSCHFFTYQKLMEIKEKDMLINLLFFMNINSCIYSLTYPYSLQGICTCIYLKKYVMCVDFHSSLFCNIFCKILRNK